MFGFKLVHIPNELTIDAKKIEKILNSIQALVPRQQKGILNIAFLSDEEIQNLNREYRGIDNTTDVLSFHYFDDFSDTKDDEITGECIFSLSKIVLQAKKFGHNEESEFYILLIHSVLHILGFDHENDADFEKMWKYEKVLREEFGLSMER